MGAIIEAGEGWQYFDHEAYNKALAVYAAKLMLGVNQGPWQEDWWSSIEPGFTIHIHPGKGVSLTQKGGIGGLVKVDSTYSGTEVKLNSKASATSEVNTEGKVVTTELQSPPTMVYKLIGPEAVLQLIQKGRAGMLEVINQPDPKIIEI